VPEQEKHEVWQEFYAANEHHKAHQPSIESEKLADKKIHVGEVEAEPQPLRKPNLKHPKQKPRSVSHVRAELLSSVENRAHARLTAKNHLKSLAFGLSMGALVIILLLFSFFNERFIAPFITPSKNVSATPIIIDPNSVSIGQDPEIIIPKINVEIPVVYDVATINEADVENGLERGVVHYATTSSPGEKGNTVIFGHSSNNIINPGKYKFAFVLLNRMDTGDTFYLQKDGKRYAYTIFEKKIVQPTDISVLDPVPGKAATATLITCDPPGTSLRRLIVVGEQVSPDPNANLASSARTDEGKPTTLASNAPSLWSRIIHIF
jgi:sortase A